MKIAIAESISTEALARLRSIPGIEMTEEIAKCEILIIRSKTLITRQFLADAPQLRLIVTATSGFDHIDWRACGERGTIACHTPDANAGSAAELTLFLLTAAFRGLLAQIDNAKSGRWRDGLIRGSALEGKILGIVGLGRIGSRVAQLASAYGMQIVAHDPYVSPETFSKCKAQRLAYVEVLRMSDAVTLHVPLTKETRHLINHATIEEMSSSAILINASRGAVVDESEVLVALRENRLGLAALDVLEREPPVSGNDLLRHPRVIVTPHVGAYTKDAFEKSSLAAVDRVLAFLKEEPVQDTLPLNTAWFEKTVAR